MDRLEPMLREQLLLQQALGKDPLQMDGEQRIEYIKEQVLSLTDELHEMLKEVGWKSWATSRHINRDAAFGEVRDALQFLVNLLFAITRWSPEVLAPALERAFFQKIAINLDRIGRYDGVSTKCPECKRALDDEGVTCTPDLGYCQEKDPGRAA